MINCSLNRYHQRNTQFANTLAAFVSGSVFWLYPDMTILSHATVSTVKLLWSRYLNEIPLWPSLADDGVETATMTSSKMLGSQKSMCRTMLERMPMSRLAYVFGIGYAFHLRLFYPWICSDLLFKTTFYTSGCM